MIFITSVIILVSNTMPVFAGYDIAWTPRISIQEEHDDNLYLANDDGVSDWITVVSPGLYLDIHSPVSMLFFDYEAGFTFYQKESVNNTVRHNAFVDIHQHLFESLELRITDRFIKWEDPIEIIDGVWGVRRTRNTYCRNVGEAQILHHFGDENLFTMGYRNLLLENEDPLLDDSMNHNYFTEAVYWFNPSNGISIEYAYNKGEFETYDDFKQNEGKATLSHRFDLLTELCLGYAFSTMDLQGANGDYHIHDWSLGITYTLPDDLSISLGTGYYIRRASGVEDDDTYSLYAELEKVFKRGFAKVGTTKGYDENFFDAENLGFSMCWIVEGQGSYMLVENIALNLSGLFRNDVFPRPGVDREEDRWEVGGGVAYTISEWCSAGIDYAYRERDSDIDLYDYTDNRFIFKLVFER